VWLTYRYHHRIAWGHALSDFFHQQFRIVYTDSYGDVLYKSDQQHGTRLTPPGARS
jgi:hypothetical protein